MLAADTQPGEEHRFSLAASRLEQRAKQLNWLSWGYLVAIVVALITAVFVFIYAPNVTNKDLARGAPVSLQALLKKQEQIASDSSHLNTEMSLLQREAAAIIYLFVRDRIGRRVDFDGNISPVNTCCDIGNYPTFIAISDAIRSTIKKGAPYPDGKYAINGSVGYNVNFSATMSKDQWIKVADDIARLKFPLTDAQLQQLQVDAEESSKLNEGLTDNSSVMAGIHQQITNAEIEQDTARLFNSEY